MSTTTGPAPEVAVMSTDEVKAQVCAWTVTDWWHVVEQPWDPAGRLAAAAYRRLGVEGGSYERVAGVVQAWLAETGVLTMTRAQGRAYRDAWHARLGAAVTAAADAARVGDWPAALAALDLVCAIDPGYGDAARAGAENIRRLAAGTSGPDQR